MLRLVWQEVQCRQSNLRKVSFLAFTPTTTPEAVLRAAPTPVVSVIAIFHQVKDRTTVSELPTIRPEFELGLGCMYSSPSDCFSAIYTFQAFGNSERPPRNNGLRGALSSDLNGQGRQPLQGGEGLSVV